MRMLHIGGPLHGDMAYVNDSPPQSFEHRVTWGKADLWDRFKPEPGEPCRHTFTHGVFYRIVCVPENFIFGIGIYGDVSRTQVYGLASLSAAEVLQYLTGEIEYGSP